MTLESSPAYDFESLSTTISSVYDLRGIGVQAVYVRYDLWAWMRETEDRKCNGRYGFLMSGEQSYDAAEVAWKETRSGAVRVTMKPYGADHNIPVKQKYSGKQPWKIVVTYKKEDA